jgi:hypothetical protein
MRALRRRGESKRPHSVRSYLPLRSNACPFLLRALFW